MTLPLHTDTICAVATAPGVGGVAIVRVSGACAFACVAQIFRPRFTQFDADNPPLRRAIYGDIYAEGELLDDVLITAFKAPHSYTGEDTIEIACHGSLYIRQILLEELIRQGCRMARAGEFSQRAYLNGRMDLSHAEAVADLIASESKAQHTMAMKQLRGGYSEELNTLRSELLRLTGLMELELDFAEEDVEFADRRELIALSERIEHKLQKLIDSYRLGNALKRGISVAIAGITNAGKSTLLNSLLGEERAIVSDIHGTTRDSIEDTINIGGYLFRFVDTAGLRETADKIESLGIERSRRQITSAEILLALIDGTRLEADRQLEYLHSIYQERKGHNTLILINKCDALTDEQRASIATRLSSELPSAPLLYLSAREAKGLDEVRSTLIDLMNRGKAIESDLIVSNARHHQLLCEAYDALRRMRVGLDEGLPTDLLTPDLRQAITSIGEITGQDITSDDTLHYIFAHFCIGK